MPITALQINFSAVLTAKGRYGIIMMDFSLKIGLIPIRRDLADAKTRKGIFEPAKAEDNKNHIVKYIKDKFTDDKTSFTDLEWLNEEGLLVSEFECDRVAEYLRNEKVDAIFLINCNFGNEEAAGQIAKKMKLPTLLWGPQDMVFEADGVRYTDCQCGLFAISKQLQRYHVPFTYINNCPVEDSRFTDGLKSFLSVASMVKNFNGMRITQVGTRLNPFKSVMYNELELTEKFGFNMQTVNMAVAEKRLYEILESAKPLLAEEVKEVKEKYITDLDDETLMRMLAFVHYYKEVFENTNADVLSTECWTSMPVAFKANPCLAMSILYDMGYIVACESAIHGAVTSALLTAASRGEKATMFGEFTCRHPENKNAELLWHCGPFPYSMKHKDAKASLFNTKPSFRAKDGGYTIARFQASGGKYSLLGGKFNTTDGPHTFGTYVWAEFNDLDKLERKLINGPYIHHMTEIYGDYTKELEEFCKYIPGLEFDSLEG